MQGMGRAASHVASDAFADRCKHTTLTAFFSTGNATEPKETGAGKGAHHWAAERWPHLRRIPRLHAGIFPLGHERASTRSGVGAHGLTSHEPRATTKRHHQYHRRRLTVYETMHETENGAAMPRRALSRDIPSGMCQDSRAISGRSGPESGTPAKGVD